MEKQIGCMTGFLQIFDRQQILAGKRIHSTKRLPPSTGVGASPETESSGESYEFSQKAELHKHAVIIPANSDNYQSSPPEKMNGRSKSPVMVPTDGEDNQRRSPSVIARLMGLEPEPLSYSDQKPPQTGAKPDLRRSGSESRVSRDLIHSKYIDDNNFQLKQPNKCYKSQKQTIERIVRDDRNYRSAGKSMESSRTSPWRSRSFFDSTDFFPEPNQRTVTMHGGYEKRLKIRGMDMDEQSNDLSALKQILEVLQLKGLLRSTNHSNGNSHRNFVYDSHFNEPNIVLVKPLRSSLSKSDYNRSVTDSRTRRHVCKTSSPNRIDSNLKACNPINKTKQSSIEIKRRDNKGKSSGIINDSPKLTPKRNRSVHHTSINRSPRNQKSTESFSINPPKPKFIKNVATENESDSISENFVSTPSITDSERSKRKSLLQSCVTERNSTTTESSASSAIVLPSPVSVLDSGFDKDEASSPSHSIDLKATPHFKDNNGSPKLSPTKPTALQEFTSDDSDFIYISEIIQASQHLPEPSNVFFSIEKQLYNTETNTSSVSKRQRKLIFDVVVEILDRNKQFPPWKPLIEDSGALVKYIWSEYKKFREINTGEGVLELVSGVIEKDLIVEVNGWRDYPMETSEAVLDIERMIFKDLVSEAIGDLVEFSGECMFFRSRRRLVF